MKKLLLTSLLCCSAMAMMADNTITVNAASGAPGETVTITLDMSTPGVTDVCAFQCDVVLPEGMAEPTDLALSSRAASTHVIASNLLDGNKYRLLCYSMTNAVVAETSGDIVSFNVIAPSAEDTYSFEVENVEIVSLAEIKAIVANGVGGNLTVEETGGVYGDVTGEGIVNASDISFVIRCIKESDPSGDVTGEGIVNASDISAIISVILNK